MKKYEDLSENEIKLIISIMQRKIYSKRIPHNSIKLSKDLLEKLLFEDNYYIDIEKNINEKYKEIRDELKPLLYKFDLKEICWDNVLVRDMDFTGTNAIIDPQTVYNKDLSFGTYPLDFTNKSFDGVNISASDFLGSKGVIINTKTIHPDLSYGRYPVKFLGSFDDIYIKYSDFTKAKYEKESLNNASIEIKDSIARARRNNK